MKDVNLFVKRRASRTSKQLQRLARIEELEEGPCSWASDGSPVGVLIAWACPELVAERMSARTKKQINDARWGIVGYYTFTGNECRIQKDSLAESEHLAIAKAQDTKVFLAAEVDRDLLHKYGIDIAQPTSHEIAMEGMPEKHEELAEPGAVEISGAQMATIEELCSVNGRQYLTGAGLTTWDDLLNRLRNLDSYRLKRIIQARSLDWSLPKPQKLDNLLEYLRAQAA